jgi:hypothetical protein
VNDADAVRGDPARTYALLLDAFRRILDNAAARGRDLTLCEKSGLNKMIPWLMHGKLGAAKAALESVLAKPCDPSEVDDERSHLGELTIDDFRRALQHLMALEPWM